LNISEPRYDYDLYRRWAKQMCWEFCRFLLPTYRRWTSVQRAYQQLYRDWTSWPLIATRVRSREQNDRILSDDRPLSPTLQTHDLLQFRSIGKAVFEDCAEQPT